MTIGRYFYSYIATSNQSFVVKYSKSGDVICVTIGSDCSEPLQTCQTNPTECGANGVCSNRTVDSTAIYCSCNLGYTGERCEQAVTACIDDQSPCLHQGYFHMKQSVIPFIYTHIS